MARRRMRGSSMKSNRGRPSGTRGPKAPIRTPMNNAMRALTKGRGKGKSRY